MFEINEKVVPISKTVYSSLYESTAWKNAKVKEQAYLYFKGFSSEGHAMCCESKEDIGSDYFALSDLIPYVDDEKLFVKGDLVRKADGSSFTHGSLTATIDRIGETGNVWLSETGTRISANLLERVEVKSEPIKESIKILKEKLSNIQSDASKIKIAIEALESVK